MEGKSKRPKDGRKIPRGLVERVKERIAEISDFVAAEAAGVELPPEDGKGVPCPKCEGDDRYRRMPHKAGKPDGVCCRHCWTKPKPGAIDMVMWRFDLPFPDAVRKLAEALGIDGGPGSAVGKRPPKRPPSGAAAARREAPQASDRPPPAFPAIVPIAEMWPAEKGESEIFGRAWDDLGLPRWAIDCMGGGVLRTTGDLAWPEFDGTGTRIGIGHRSLRGVKRAWPGSKRGLIVPADETLLRERIDRFGFVSVLEGFSDTAAQFALGLPAIGRPQAQGKAATEFLAGTLGRLVPEMANGGGPRIVVLAENDRKEDGTWPGRKGAEATAQALANLLGRPVETAFPPALPAGPAVKDVRAWTQGRGLGAETDPAEWERLGGEFLTGLKTDRTFEPEPAAEPAADEQLSPFELGCVAAAVERDNIRNSRKNLPLVAIGAGGEGNMPDEADDVRRVLEKLPTHDCGFFLVGNRPCRMQFRPSKFAPHTTASIGLFIAEKVNLFTTESDEPTFVSCPKGMREAIRDSVEYPAHISRADSIVPYPVLRSDGNFTSLGFDDSARVYCESHAADALPEKPTHREAREAAAKLFDLVDEFPWRTPADRAAWLAFMLTFLMRPAIGGPAPLFAFDATVNGAGKSFLIELAWRILTGNGPSVSGLPEVDEETDKRITASLIAGAAAIFFDDVHHEVGGPSLQRYLTASATYAGRLLGESRMVEFPARAVISVTGNNLGYATPDMRRRTLPIRLKPAGDPIRNRTFRYPDLQGYAAAHRDELLPALLTIVRAWITAGRPKASPPLRNFSSFEAWSIVREVVVWLGEPDPLATRSDLDEDRDGATEALAEFLQWFDTADRTRHGLTAAAVRGELLKDPEGPLARYFTACTGRSVDERLTPEAVGRSLRTLLDRPAGGRVLNLRKPKGEKLYRAERAASRAVSASVRPEDYDEAPATVPFSVRHGEVTATPAENRHPPQPEPQPQEPPEFQAETNGGGGGGGFSPVDARNPATTIATAVEQPDDVSPSVPSEEFSGAAGGGEAPTFPRPDPATAIAALYAIAVDEPTEPPATHGNSPPATAVHCEESRNAADHGRNSGKGVAAAAPVGSPESPPAEYGTQPPPAPPVDHAALIREREERLAADARRQRQAKPARTLFDKLDGGAA